jgi:hypothetical protein
MKYCLPLPFGVILGEYHELVTLLQHQLAQTYNDGGA